MKKILFLSILPAIILASGGDGPKDYDIIPRTFNFILFFGVLFYLVKDFAKKAYNDRINSIATRLDDIQVKLEDSKAKKLEAQKEVALAKTRGEALIDVAKKEIESLKVKSENDIKNEIASLEKSYEGKKEFETKRATKAVVDEILTEAFSDESIKLSQDELVNIVNKKAS